MTTIYHELLPESYQLLLTPEASNEPARALAQALEYSLGCAYRSGKPAVWINCEGMRALPIEAVRVLSDYQQKLEKQHVQLVLVHAPEEVQQNLLGRKEGSGSDCEFILVDAAWSCQALPA